MRVPVFTSRKHRRIETAIIAMPLFIFAYVLTLIVRDVTLEHETELMKKLHTIEHPVLDRIMLFITDTGSGARYIPLSIVLLWNWRRGLKDEMLLIAGVVGVAQVTSWVIKASVQRTRPNAFKTIRPLPHDTSFPSGHTLGAAAVYGSIGTFLWKRGHRGLAACFLGWMFPVAFSRVYLGVHFPTDVFASIMLGTSSLRALSLGLDYQQRKDSEQ